MSKYNEVMKLLSENNLDPMVCCSMLKGLLELFNSQFSSQQANAGEADQKIPYLIYKNLAHYNILAGNIDAALSCYAKVIQTLGTVWVYTKLIIDFQAVQLDSSDWMSWKKLGDLAFDCKVSNLRLAEYAYENVSRA